MITRKNNTLSIFLGFIAFIFLISLACNVPIKNEPDDALPEAPLASQEVNTGPNRAPTVPPKLEVSKPEPEAEPEPEPEADPVSPQVLNAVPAVLGKTGFGQKQQEVGYGFELTNNNVDVAIRSIPFQIAVYDSNNKVVDTEGGYTDYIYSGETLGVGGTIYLDEGVKAGKIEVQVSEGEPIVAEFTEPFIVDQVVYVPSEYYSSVRGVITNPYDQDITSVKVSAILYDEADNIIGGGNTYLSFLLANSSAGVIVPVSGSDNVSRVELYPSITNIYEYENPNPIPEGASNLSILKQGFSQNNTSLAIGMMVENPNQDYAIESSMYQCTSYSKDGTVLGVSVGYISLLLPTQTLGIADSQYLDEGAIVDRVDIQIKTGYFTESNILPMFTSENITYIPDEYSPQVTGEIVSPYSKEVSNIRVDAIAYNEAGDIIGSGYTYLNFIPANSKAAVAVYITIAGTPATIELYAAPSALSDIEE